jgi:hypothetical protein
MTMRSNARDTPEHFVDVVEYFRLHDLKLRRQLSLVGCANWYACVFT